MAKEKSKTNVTARAQGKAAPNGDGGAGGSQPSAPAKDEPKS